MKLDSNARPAAAVKAVPEKAKFRWDAADIAKLGMSIAILMLHTRILGPLTDCIYPLLRMAVPLFFMVSAFLFFRKLEGGGSPKLRFGEAVGKLKHFAARSAKLYFFWLAVLIVPTAILRGWYAMPWWEVVAEVAFRVAFGSTFVASWYLSASVVALAILVALRYGAGMRCCGILALGVLGYTLALAFQPYAWLLGGGFAAFSNELASLWAPYNSFPVALLWMGVGMAVASGRSRIEGAKSGVIAAIAVAGVVLVYVERMVVCSVDPSLGSADVWIFLPMACIPCFMLLLRCRIRIAHGLAIDFRRTSTIVYCLHGTVAACVRAVLNRIAPALPVETLCGLVTLAVCAGAVAVLLRLADRPRLGWLKNTW